MQAKRSMNVKGCLVELALFRLEAADNRAVFFVDGRMRCREPRDGAKTHLVVLSSISVNSVYLFKMDVNRCRMPSSNPAQCGFSVAKCQEFLERRHHVEKDSRHTERGRGSLGMFFQREWIAPDEF